jgi:diguanylate cyclase (GGDEF)-like protein
MSLRILKNSRLFVVMVVIVFVASFASITWLQARQYEQLSKTVSSQDHQQRWAFMSLNVEYQRLAHALDLNLYKDGPIDHDGLQLRYDLFVSWMSQLKLGAFAVMLEQDMAHRKTLEDLAAFVAYADRYLGPGPQQPLDRTVLLRLRDAFVALREPVNNLVLEVNERNSFALDQQRIELRQQAVFNLVLNTVQSLMAVALALAVIRQTRRRAQSQTDLLDAKNTMVHNLQRHQAELGQRIAERTSELQEANCQLAALSTTDDLTGIANRRRFDSALRQEWQRAKRNRQPLALAMLDVDWFKRYNDHYGHPMGDNCLRQVAAVLESQVRRSGDIVARYGGEEFVFIAPNTDMSMVFDMAEQVRQALEDLVLPHEMSPLGHVTVSIGVAAVVPDDKQPPEWLVAQADRALYQAKADGRNRAQKAIPGMHDGEIDAQPSNYMTL